MGSERRRFEVGDFVLDVRNYALLRGAESVRVEPKVFDVLRYLLEHADRVVTRDELLDELWPNEVVTPAVVATAIAGVRRALGQARGRWEPIQTVHGRGYKLSVPVRVSDEPAPAPRSSRPPPDAHDGPALAPSRAAVLERMLAALAEAEAGRSRVLLLVGDDGMGKSLLCAALAERARSRGIAVWRGAGSPVDGAPFSPWLPVLRLALAESSGKELALALGHALLHDLALLLPELSGPATSARAAPSAPPLPLTHVDDGSFERVRLLDAACRLLLAAARATPHLIVLEDLHLCEPSSLALLEYVVRQLDDQPLLLVATSRYASPAGDDGADEARAALAGMSRLETLALSALTAAELPCLFAAGAAPEGAALAHLHAESHGNPLVLRWLADEQAREPQAPATSLRERLRARIAALDDGARELLFGAAVLGPSAEVKTLEAMFGLRLRARRAAQRGVRLGRPRALDPAARRDFVRSLLDEPSLAGLLERADPHARQHRFAHALVREAVYAEIPGRERAALHRLAASALIDQRLEHPQVTCASIAYHAERALLFDTTALPGEWLVRAADEALERLGYLEAAQCFERALSLASTGAAEPERAWLQLRAAHAHHLCWDPADRAGSLPLLRVAEQGYRAVVEHALHQGDPELLARGALGLHLRSGPPLSVIDPVFGRAGPRAEVEVTVRGLLQQALSRLPAERVDLRAMVLGRLAVASEGEDRHARCEQALQLGREADHDEVLFDALSVALFIARGPDHSSRRIALADELLARARRAGEPYRQWQARRERYDVLRELSQIDAAEQELIELRRLAEEVRHPLMTTHLRVLKANRALARGRYEGVARDVPIVAAEGERARLPRAGMHAGSTVMGLLFDRGGLSLIEGRREAALDESRFLRGVGLPMTALINALTGKPALARADLERLAIDRLLPEMRLYGLSLASWALSVLGEPLRARELLAALSPYADRNATSPLGHELGSVQLYLGQLHQVLGARADALSAFGAACEHNARMGSRPWLARARLAHGRALVQHGRTREGVEQMRAAHALASELGMRPLVQECVAAGGL